MLLSTPLPPYRPIDSARGEVRLLVLEPASSKRESEICGRLEPVFLSSSPKFDALSYTWGSQEGSGTIRLNGVDFYVTENLYAALRELRSGWRPRRLWIDAVCVNQTDPTERNAQLSLMQQIYGNAKLVIAWLGDLTDGARIGVKYLRWGMPTSARDSARLNKAYGPLNFSRYGLLLGSTAQRNDLDLIEEQLTGEVRELLDRPYWHRVWIIQEAVMARKLVLMCGPETVAWNALKKLRVLERLQNKATVVFGISMDSTFHYPDATHHAISGLRKKWRSAPTTINMFDTLYRFRPCECTDPRDRVFGFFGMMPREALGDIAPDYKKTLAKSYLSFAHESILTTNSLDILNCKREWQTAAKPEEFACAYSLHDQSRYYDISARVTSRPGGRARRGWARLPDGWERIPGGNTSLYVDHNAGMLHEKSPLDATQTAQPVDIDPNQKVLPLGWTKTWDNVGRALVTYDSNKEEDFPKSMAERLLTKLLSKLPSWVPNWEYPTAWDPKPLIDWNSQQRQYWASGSTVPAVRNQNVAHTLALDGLLVDEIECLAEPWHPESDLPPISRRGIAVLEAWEALATHEVPHCPYEGRGGRANALWRTMIADRAGDQAAPAADAAYIETWFNRTDWAKVPPAQAPTSFWSANWRKMRLQTLQQKMLTALAQHSVPPDAHFPRLQALLQLKSPDNYTFFRKPRKYGEYLRRIHRACAHRALGVTRRGYLVLAPWNAQKGDQVAVLLGGRTPFLLRKQAKCHEYTLVGEAYVYGLMAGEALANNGAEEPQVQAIRIV